MFTSNYARYLQTVLFHTSWSKIIETMDNEEAGRLIKMFCDFISGETVEVEDDKIGGVFLMMADQAETSARKYLLKAGSIDE